MRSRRV